MNHCKKKRTCLYGSTIGSYAFCDYIGVTGKPRGCPADACTKYEPKRRKRHNLYSGDLEFKEE